MGVNKDYLTSSITLIPTTGSDEYSKYILNQVGEVDYNSLCGYMFDRMKNTPYLFRVTGQFGVDPEALNICLPAGSIQQARWDGDPVLNQYMINDRFTVLTLAKAVGIINSTFANSANGIPSLVSVIGDVSTIDLDGSGFGNIPSLVTAIGTDALNSGITQRGNLVDAINSVYTRKTSFLLTFCSAQGDTSVSPVPDPNATTIVQQNYVDNMQGLLQIPKIVGSVSHLVDQFFTCMKLVAKISQGSPGSYTVTNNGAPYLNKGDCITNVGAEISGYATGTNFHDGINDADIKPIIVGEICAQYLD